MLPGVYNRYHAKKISDMCGAEVRELLSEAFNCCLVGSAADVGDGAAVTAAQFVEVLQVLRPGGILVLNVREETTKSEARGNANANNLFTFEKVVISDYDRFPAEGAVPLPGRKVLRAP